MKMTLAATKPNEQIYFVIDPKEPQSDGVVVSNGTVRYVPFWSYVTREDISPVRSNQFLQELWSNGATSDWTKVYFLREEKISEDRIESVSPYLIDVPDETESGVATDDLRPIRATEEKADSPVRPGGIVRRLRSGRQRAGLAMEPYDPDARDGDNDGVVQEGTAWERPAGTRILDVLGREIRRGRQAGKRPLGVRVVDRDGNDVDYKPTYEDGKPGTIGSTVQRITPTVKPIEEPAVPTPAKKAAAKKMAKPKKGTPLSEHGAESLQERGLPSTREVHRTATTPPQPEVPETPVAPEVPKVVEKPKPKKPKETPVVDDFALASGVNLDSIDRPELVKPERPRSPYKPSPPPLSGRAQELADQAGGDFGRFMDLLDKEGYVVFDYETTGLQDGNIPVQIGAVRIKDGKIVERFNVFTNPQRPLSDWSKENLKDRDGNPLTDEWLGQQMDLAEAHKQLAEFMGDSIIVAHNLPYDGEIIDRMMKDAEINHQPSGSIDTLMLLRSAVPKGDGETGPERHTLGSLADFFGVDLGDAAHTADADSEAAGQVLQRAMKWAKDNDSDPEIFDAEKQKELFDAATKKYNIDRKKYEEDLKQYQSDLADYERAVVKADEPEAGPPQPKTRSRNTAYKRNVPYRKESYKETNEPNENGILQEGTIWERPEGTEFVDANGRPMRMFQNRTKRQFLVDQSTGEPVDYVPTYERPDFVSPADLIERRPLKEGDHPVMEFYEPGKSVKPEVIEGQLQKTRAFRVEQINKRLDRLTDEELDKALKIYKVSDRAALVDKLLDLGDDRVIADIDAIRAKPLYVAMSPSGLKAFLKSKRFKSQFEKSKAKRNAARPTRGGYFNPERRRGIEEELLGIPAGLPDELRPAYGFQMTQHEEDASMLPTTGFAADGYGAVVLRLKDSVRSRTTMSHGDSSDYRIPVIPVDGDVQRDAQIAAVGLGNNAGDLEVLRELASAVDRDPDEFTSGMFGGSPSYSEIQIHGGFSLDDVEEVHFYLGDYSESGQIIQGENGRGYVYVNEERVGSPNKIREDIVKALEQAGLPYTEDKK